jgi:hypothetical protein
MRRKRIVGVEYTVRNRAEAQALSEFLYKEGKRHGDDIRKIVEDLRLLERKWKVKPRGIFVGKWVKP